MLLSDPIWVYFNQLGHVVGYKQKRRQCKNCGHQINDSLRQARAYFKKCTEVILIQK
jgi:hypothetical protein